MNTKELYEKVQLLKAGQIVEIEGNFWIAKQLPKDSDLEPCDECNADCLCKGDVAKICLTMDFLGSYNWYLKLACE